MDPVSQSKTRHRPWEPRTKALTQRANALVDIALEDQLKSRRERNSRQGTATRVGTKERRTVEALILDVLCNHLADGPDAPLGIHLGNDWLRGGHDRPEAVNAGVRKRIIDLETSGWLLVSKGNNHGRGRLTSLHAGPVLHWAADSLDVGLSDITRELVSADEIILRGEKPSSDYGPSREARERIHFAETVETELLRHQVRRLNEHFATVQLDQLQGSEEPIDLSRRIVNRAFLDGRFDRGGRLGGAAFWLTLEKDRRRNHLLIDGEPIAEVDLTAAHPAIAYGLEGLVMEHDPYCPPELADIPRETLKLASMVFLWDRYKPRSGRFPGKIYEGLPEGVTYGQVYEALLRHNQPIADYLGNAEPRGAELMWHESEIIIDATVRCFDAGISALPIHDALVVPVSKAEKAQRLLSEAFEARLGVAPMVSLKSFEKELVNG
jgi:hypothetical protein